VIIMQFEILCSELFIPHNVAGNYKQIRLILSGVICSTIYLKAFSGALMFVNR